MTPVAQTVAAYLAEANAARDAEYRAGEHARFHLSGALRCHRQRSFDALGVEGTDPRDGNLLAPALGTATHTLLHDAMTWTYGADYTPEARVDFRPNIDLTGYADGLLTRDARTVFEYKTMRSYPFQLATTGAGTHRPEGPKLEHVVQGGIAAVGLEAARLVVVYVDMESKAVAEWEYTMASTVSPRLTLAQAVADELAEIVELGDLLDRGRLAEAYVPGFGVVAEPPRPGSKGQPWGCRWCSHRSLCVALGPQSLSLDHLASHADNR